MVYSVKGSTQTQQGKCWHLFLIRVCKETFKDTQNSSFGAVIICNPVPTLDSCYINSLYFEYHAVSNCSAYFRDRVDSFSCSALAKGYRGRRNGNPSAEYVRRAINGFSIYHLELVKTQLYLLLLLPGISPIVDRPEGTLCIWQDVKYWLLVQLHFFPIIFYIRWRVSKQVDG